VPDTAGIETAGIETAGPGTAGPEPVWRAVTAWYAQAARDLPWRRPGTDPWAVLVSEVMLQQTPVSRVVPAWRAWVDRWPTPPALAADEPGEAVRAWGRLGYPRRALRLHAAACAVVDRHGGRLPETVPELLALPGVGDYTARAVAAFAFRQRHPVVDTNVRRVVARAVEGVADAPVARRDLALVESLLPQDPEAAATTSVALMELGALVCTARSPGCGACPLATTCRWRTAGCPPLTTPVRRLQAWAGTDRQVRGRLMAALRTSEGPVTAATLATTWDDPVQRARCLDSLVADGLAEPLEDGTYSLPRRQAAEGT
jgi:A/G-specific adenine glycosylase